MDLVAETLEYNKIWLADFFHGFPHLDKSLKQISSTFQPQNQEYRESLFVLCAFPLVWCAFLWLCFLIFFCVRCCKVSTRVKHGKAICSRFCAWLFLLLGCGSLALAFYGNVQVHSGVKGFVQQVDSANQTIEDALDVFTYLDRIVMRTDSKDLPDLWNSIDGLPNATVLNYIKGLINTISADISSINSSISDVKTDAQTVDTEKITDTAEMIENYRLIVAVCIYCGYICIFLLAFTGLIKKSRHILIVSAVIAIFCLLVIYASMAVHLALSVASADFCQDPNAFVISQANGTLQQDIVQAFIKCDDQSKPYRDEIQNAQTNVADALKVLNMTVNATLPFNMTNKISVAVNELRQDLRSALGNLTVLSTLVGSCDVIHNEYIMAVNSLCLTMLTGAGYEVLSTALVALFAVLLAVCAAVAWPYFQKRRCHGQVQGHEHANDTDPFLPSDPPSYEQNYGSFRGTAVSQPSYVPRNGLQGDLSSMPQQDPLNDSPPPAYQSGHFIQQYHILAPTPSSIIQSSQTMT